MKACFRCGESKPLTEFYKHSRMSDGHLGKCKRCTRADVRIRTATGAALEYDHKRNKDPKRIAASLGRTKKMRQDRKKQAAHNAVARAIKNGTLIRQPCETCGSNNVHGHHDDYDRKLEVRWLCPTHHARHHARL